MHRYLNKFLLSGTLATIVAGYTIDLSLSFAFLQGEIAAFQHVWREDPARYYWLVLITYPLFSYVFVYLFSRLHTGGGVLEGLRYGLLIGLLFSVPSALMQFVFYPISLKLALGWIASGLTTQAICGALLGWIWLYNSNDSAR